MLGRHTLLVNPPLINGVAFTRQGRCQEREEVLGTTKPPYTLALLATLLRDAGCQVRLIDLTAERRTIDDLAALSRRGFALRTVMRRFAHSLLVLGGRFDARGNSRSSRSEGGFRRQAARTQIAAAVGAIVGTIAAALVGDWLGRRITYSLLCVLSLMSLLVLYQGNTEYGSKFLASTFLVGVCTASFYGWLPLYLPVESCQ